MRIGYQFLSLFFFGCPLVFTSGTFYQFPFILEQVLKKAHIPGCWFIGPCTFKSAGNGIGSLTGSITVFPTQTLLFKWCSLRIGAIVLLGRCTVNLTKSMSTGYKRNGLVIIHGHSFKRLTDIFCRFCRIGLTVRTFRIYIDQAHMVCRQGAFQGTFIIVPGISKPFMLGTPINILFWLPNIFTASTESESFESHRFKGNVTCQNNQVGPGNFLSIFLFNGPKQSSCFIEAHIIGPAIDGGKTLIPGTSSSTAVGYSICSGAVPGHAYKKASIMAPIGRPPIF